MNKIEAIKRLKECIEDCTSGEDDIYKEAFGVAIAVLEAQQENKWVPVSERLPNEEECNIYEAEHPCHREFICTIKIGDYEPQTRQLFFSKVFGWKYGPGDYNEYVTAWRPLPEPWNMKP